MSQTAVDGETRTHEIAWTSARVAALWDYYGRNRAYDAQYFSAHSGRWLLEFVNRHVPLAGRRVLDFGCGPGFMLEHLLRDDIPCLGLEFSSASVERLRARFGTHSRFLGAIEAQALPVELPDGSVDAILMVEVIEHLLPDDVARVLREVRRLLVPGGALIVTTPHAEDLEASKVLCPECGCIFHRWQHLRAFDAPALRALVESGGFETTLCQPTLFAPRGRLDWLRRLLRRGRAAPPPLPHLVYLGRTPLEGEARDGRP